MGYKKKIYGSGFEVLRKHENWDLAIWHDSSPKTLDSNAVYKKKLLNKEHT